MPHPRPSLSLLIAVLVLAITPAAPAQILKLGELNTTQIQALDRAHTVILLTDGIVEEHGPFLPTFTDGYLDESIAQDLARSIVARPGWTAVLFPTIPLGTDPANDIGHRFTFPGSFTITASTMRAIFMDLADSIGQQGFRYVLIIDSHGGPANSRALDQASDYFHDTYHGRMTHLFGLMPVLDACKALEQSLTPGQLTDNGLSVHADTLEQSLGIYLRPDLSPTAYLQAPNLPGATFEELTAQAAKPTWPGYLGAPRYATPALGALAYNQYMEALRHLTPDILDGKLDPTTLPRYGTVFSDLAKDVELSALSDQATKTTQQTKWLATQPPSNPTHP